MSDADTVVKNAIHIALMRCVVALAVVKGDKVLMVEAKRGFSKGC